MVARCHRSVSSSSATLTLLCARSLSFRLRTTWRLSLSECAPSMRISSVSEAMGKRSVLLVSSVNVILFCLCDVTALAGFHLASLDYRFCITADRQKLPIANFWIESFFLLDHHRQQLWGPFREKFFAQFFFYNNRAFRKTAEPFLHHRAFSCLVHIHRYKVLLVGIAARNRDRVPRLIRTAYGGSGVHDCRMGIDPGPFAIICKFRKDFLYFRRSCKQPHPNNKNRGWGDE